MGIQFRPPRIGGKFRFTATIDTPWMSYDLTADSAPEFQQQLAAFSDAIEGMDADARQIEALSRDLGTSAAKKLDAAIAKAMGIQGAENAPN